MTNNLEIGGPVLRNFDPPKCSINLFEEINRKYTTEGEILEKIRKCSLVHFDINLQDDDGKTLLHIAVENDYPAIAWYLLKNGANSNIVDKSGKTAQELSKENLPMNGIFQKISKEFAPKIKRFKCEDSPTGKIRTAKVRSFRKSTKDVIHQFKCMVHCLMNGSKRDCKLKILPSLNKIQTLDDLMFHFTTKTNVKIYQFLLGDDSTLDCDMMLSSDPFQSFSILNLYKEYRKIFEKGYYNCDFIICTNLSCTYEADTSKPYYFKALRNASSRGVHSLPVPNAKIEFKDPDAICNDLNAKTDIAILCDVLVNSVLQNHVLGLDNPILQLYHVALAKYVVDINNQCFYPNFIKNENLSENVVLFRSVFKSKLLSKLSEIEDDEETFHNKMQGKLRLGGGFGIPAELASEANLSNCAKLSKELVKLIKESNEVIKIELNKRDDLITDFQKLNGYMFVKDNDNFRVSSIFLDHDILLPGDLEEFRYCLCRDLQELNLFCKLADFRFDIVGANPIEEWQIFFKDDLPNDVIDKNNFSWFVMELKFHFNMPNKDEIDAIFLNKYESRLSDVFYVLNVAPDNFEKDLLRCFSHNASNKEFESLRIIDLVKALEIDMKNSLYRGLPNLYIQKLQSFEVSLEKEVPSIKTFVLSHCQQVEILNVYVSDTILGSLQVLQTVQRLKKINECIFIREEDFQSNETSNFLLEVSKWSKFKLLVIEAMPGYVQNNLFYYNLREIQRYINKIIIIADKDMLLPKIFDDCGRSTVVNLHTSFSDFENMSKKELLSTRVDFQGLTVAASSIINEELFSPNILGDLIRDRLKIGKEVSPVSNQVPFYFRPYLNRFVEVKKEIIQDSETKDLFIISGLHKNQSCDITENCSRILINSDHEHLESLYPNTSVHHLFYDDGNFIWKNSTGSVSLILKYRMETPCIQQRIVPENLIAPQFERKTTVISGNIGSGKNVILDTLCYLTKQLHPSIWVLKINLNYCRDNLHFDVTEQNYLDFLVNHLTTGSNRRNKYFQNDFEKDLFKSLFKKGQVAIFIYGYDQVDSSCKQKLLNLLKYIKSSNLLHTFVTTTPEYKSKLEEALDTVAFDVFPMSESDQKRFFENFSRRYAFEISRTYAENFCDSLFPAIQPFLDDKNRKIIENPLMIKLLIQRGFEDLIERNEPFRNGSFDGLDLFSIYSTFTATKICFYLEKNLGFSLYNAEREIYCDIKKRLKDNLKNLALEASESDFKDILPVEVLVDFSKFSIKEPSNHYCSVVDDDKQFIHWSLGHYFIADILYSTEPTENVAEFIFTNVLLKPEYYLIRTFTNWDDSFLSKYSDKFRFLWMEQRDRLSNEDNKNILHIASEEGNIALVKALINLASNDETFIEELINSVCSKGRTNLHYAAKSGELDSTIIFINRLKNIDVQDHFGMTPLHVAAAESNFIITDYLLKNAANPNIKDAHGDTVLIMAAKSGNLNIVQVLRNFGANLNEMNNFGYNALRIALKYGHVDIVQYIIDCCNMSVNEINYYEKIATSYVEEFGHFQVLKYFEFLQKKHRIEEKYHKFFTEQLLSETDSKIN